MKKIVPESIDFIVTDKCNLHCYVCWGSEMPDYEDLSLEERKRMIDVFAAKGAKKNVFTGGEPTLDEMLPELMKHSKKEGMQTLLFTNCTTMNKRYADKIMPYVDSISMSLDGSNEEFNSFPRRAGHFKKVMNTLKLLTNYDTNVQVLTVVTHKNRFDLRDIGNLLLRKTEGLDFQWKLNYYSRIGRSAKKYFLAGDPFFIKYEGFLEAVGATRKYFEGKLNIRYSLRQHDYGYLFIFPDGNLYTTKGAKYISLGNAFDEKSWKKSTIRRIADNIYERAQIVGDKK